MNTTVNVSASASKASNDSVKAAAYALFAIGFICAYLYFMGFNIALFTYFPQTMEFRWGTVKMPESGPGMTWYGWMGYSALVGGAAALLAWIPGVRKLFNASRWASVAAGVAVIVTLVLVWIYKKHFM
jgi:hypothetical protein